MEKKIIVKMLSSKDIEVNVADSAKLIINKDNRTVKADDIYRLIDYSRGDTYSVDSINDENLDAPVHQFFYQLILDIVECLNRISESEEEDELLTDYYDIQETEPPF